jgi:hypothetical protein
MDLGGVGPSVGAKDIGSGGQVPISVGVVDDIPRDVERLDGLPVRVSRSERHSWGALILDQRLPKRFDFDPSLAEDHLALSWTRSPEDSKRADAFPMSQRVGFSVSECPLGERAPWGRVGRCPVGDRFNEQMNRKRASGECDASAFAACPRAGAQLTHWTASDRIPRGPEGPWRGSEWPSDALAMPIRVLRARGSPSAGAVGGLHSESPVKTHPWQDRARDCGRE